MKKFFSKILILTLVFFIAINLISRSQCLGSSTPAPMPTPTPTPEPKTEETAFPTLPGQSTPVLQPTQPSSEDETQVFPGLPTPTPKLEPISQQTSDDDSENDDNQQQASEDSKQATQNVKKTASDIPTIIKEAVAKWYYIMRLIVIAFMLLLLLFIGIKMALSTIASEKAVYKQMLVDWVAGMIIVFSIHYIMIFILNVNEAVVNALKPLAQEGSEIQEEYEYGDEKYKKTTGEIETTLYESARTRAYDLKLTNGFTGMIIYGVLVYYAWRFALMYFKRLINIIILTLLAPAVSASYAINKVLTGKAKVFSTWLSEYVMNVITQIIHVIIYSSFVSIVLKVSLESLPGIILAFVLLNFMLKADKTLRELFKLSGGEGSLAGDMQNHSTFSDLKNDFKQMENAMIGGKATQLAMKSTYRLATKPVRYGTEVAFGTAMAHRANSGKYKEKQEAKDKEKILNAYDKFTNGEVSKEKFDEKEKMKKELESKLGEKAALEAELGYFWQQEDEEGVRRTKQKLDEIEQAEQKIEALKKREQQLQDEFIQNYQASGTIRDSLRKGTRALFDPTKYAELGEDGKFHRKKSKRVGGVKGAFWRKKKSSIGKTFFENAKWKKMLGFSEEDEKDFAKELSFLKNSTLGVLSSIVGLPALVVNPTLGMMLLSQAMVSRLDAMTRRRLLKNRATHTKGKFQFKEFGPGAQNAIKQEALDQIKEAENEIAQKNMKKHGKVLTKVIESTKIIAKPIKVGGTVVSGVCLGMPLTKSMNVKDASGRYVRKRIKVTAFEEDKLDENFQKALRESFLQTKRQIITEESYELSTDYKKLFEQFEAQVQKDEQGKSEEQLFLQDKLSKENSVAIGTTIITIESNDAISKLAEDADQIESRDDITKSEKIKLINEHISNNRDELIESSIIKLATQKGVTDIENLKLNGADYVEVKQNIVGILEKNGIVKKGEIDLDNTRISDNSITNVHKKLTQNKQNTNENIEQKIVEASILEYMSKKGVQDTNILQNDSAKQEIYDIIKEKMMPQASKQSASVISKISGTDSITQNFQLSNSVEDTVQRVVKKVKKTSTSKLIANSGNTTKKKLVRKQTRRKSNELRDNLAQALYTGDKTSLDEKQLELLLLLQELGKKNEEAQKVSTKSNKKKSKTLNELRYYEQKSGRSTTSAVNSTQRLKGLETQIHGPEIDILDLISQIGK